MDVADQGHRDEVGHDAARGQDPEAALAVADEVAQPAQDLLLDERADRAGVPDVDALLGDLGEDFAGHGGEQRRRGEVAERARVVGAHRVRRDPRRRTRRAPPGASSDRAAPAPGRRMARRTRPAARRSRPAAHRPPERVVVQVVERGLPDRRAGLAQRLARAAASRTEISSGSGCQSMRRTGASPSRRTPDDGTGADTWARPWLRVRCA